MIDKRGEWWRGNSPDDIGEYLRYHEAGGFPVARVVASICSHCAGTVFALAADDDQGYARRICNSCGKSHAMLDSANYEDDAEPRDCRCPCGCEAFELAVGYALRADDEVRWVSIGCRCTSCGILGCYADWKIDYGPTDSLFSSA
jgi:hypothetical protein